MTITKAFAVAGTVALIATPLAAKPLFDPPKDGVVEVVRPSAAGQPKRFSAQVTATCENGFCTAEFGKKNGKERTVEALTCLIYSTGVNLFASVNLVDGGEDNYEFFLPMTSNQAFGGFNYSVFVWTKNFTVPSGAPLNVVMQTSTLQAESFCTANGTIR